MNGIITNISELISGKGSNYHKIFIDDIPFTFFINSMNDKTILINLSIGCEVDYEVTENNGFPYLKSISKVITPLKKEIIFKQPLSTPQQPHIKQEQEIFNYDWNDVIITSDEHIVDKEKRLIWVGKEQVNKIREYKSNQVSKSISMPPIPVPTNQTPPFNRERLIIMQSLLKCVSMNSKKNSTAEQLMNKAKELYDLLMEIK